MLRAGAGVDRADDIGNGQEIGDGSVPPDQENNARLAVANCPERAVIIEDGA